MADLSIVDPKSWRDLADQVHRASENLNDPLAWARMVALEDACKRLEQLAGERKRLADQRRRRSFARISRISGGVW